MKNSRLGLVAAALLVLYLFSFGPACWLAHRDLVSEQHVAQVYMPVVYLALVEPTGLLNAWANLAVPGGGMIVYLYQGSQPRTSANTSAITCRTIGSSSRLWGDP